MTEEEFKKAFMTMPVLYISEMTGKSPSSIYQWGRRLGLKRPPLPKKAPLEVYSRLANDSTLKWCGRCGSLKPRSDFVKHRTSIDGLALPCKECKKELHDPIRAKNLRLILEYGITLEDFKSILKNQNGCCAICKDSLSKLHLDHSHKTGKIRGALCNNCNNGLGRFKDSLNVLKAASEYLIKHDSRKKI